MSHGHVFLDRDNEGSADGCVTIAREGASLGLTMTLAGELGKHSTTVDAVATGAIVSEAEARVFGDEAQEYGERVLELRCMKTRLQLEEVARLVAFLVSPAADLITGQNVGVDGGWQGGKAPGTQ